MVVGTHIVQHRAIASTAAIIAENDDNADNEENGSPSHRKRTMTSCYKPTEPHLLSSILHTALRRKPKSHSAEAEASGIKSPATRPLTVKLYIMH